MPTNIATFYITLKTKISESHGEISNYQRGGFTIGL